MLEGQTDLLAHHHPVQMPKDLIADSLSSQGHFRESAQCEGDKGERALPLSCQANCLTNHPTPSVTHMQKLFLFLPCHTGKSSLYTSSRLPSSSLDLVYYSVCKERVSEGKAICFLCSGPGDMQVIST